MPNRDILHSFVRLLLLIWVWVAGATVSVGKPRRSSPRPLPPSPQGGCRRFPSACILTEGIPWIREDNKRKDNLNLAHWIESIKSFKSAPCTHNYRKDYQKKGIAILCIARCKQNSVLSEVFTESMTVQSNKCTTCIPIQY